MEHLLKDIRHGLRTLWKHRGMSALAILAIAVGIGTVATQFSVVHGALFRGLPVPEGDRLHIVEWAVPEGQRIDEDIAIQDLVELQRQQTSFEALTGYYGGTVNFRNNGQPIRLQGAFVSAGWLDTLRVRPALGRGSSRAKTSRGPSRSPFSATPSGSANSAETTASSIAPYSRTAGRRVSSA